MITLISGTNRNNSFTLKLAQLYSRSLALKGIPHLFLDLAEIAPSALLDHNYSGRRNDLIDHIQSKYFVPASKFIMIVPEYNGSYPGVLKLLIDSLDPGISIRRKKASLVGISSGRGGNLRGLDQLSGVLHYLQVQVMPFLASLPRIEESFNDSGLPNEKLISLLEEHIERTLLF